MPDGANYPVVRPFTYVLIPCDEAAAVTQRRFDGDDEAALRATLRRHFRQQLLSDEQRQHMTRHLIEKANEKAAAHASTNAATTTTTTTSEAADVATSTQQQQQQEQLIEHYLDEASFEIVPVTMPTRDTRYVGTSLYIDDSGAFKDLPLNTRASALAQRPIRGDAFLLANHDDPALDEWGRVDCTLHDYETLRAQPTQRTRYDTSNTAQMAATTAQRESEAKRVSESDARAAVAAKDDGNRLLMHDKDVHAAVQAYTHAIELTEGRRDLLADEAAATRTRVQALLNRSLAHNQLRRYDMAAHDAQAALALDAHNVKAHYRLAAALLGSRDYDGATRAVQAFVQHGGDDATAAALRASIASGAQALKAEQRARYSKLFA